MATIIRTVRNITSTVFTVTTQKVVLSPSVDVDLYTHLTDDQLIVAQSEIQGLVDRGALSIIATDDDAELKASGAENSFGTFVAYNDNATSFRLRGPQHASEGGADVQSYSGIFYNDAYDTLGTLKTRASFGTNLETDLVFQSPHALMLLAVDDTQNDGVLVATSKTNFKFHARANAEVESPKQLIIDRVDTGSTGAVNTSDVNLRANTGNLRLNSGVVDGAVILPSLTTVQRDAISPVVAGMVVYNGTTNKLNFHNGSAWEEVTSA